MKKKSVEMRALELAVQMFSENTEGCRDCPLYDFVNAEYCTKMDCNRDILQYIMGKAKKEMDKEKI
jgi:hypothetical protein